MRLADFGDLTEAEQAVIDGLGTGHVTKLGDSVPGPEAGDDRRVRASLIRWLALGAPGDKNVHLHEHGLRIKGALVVSDGQADPEVPGETTPGLDLEGCTITHNLALLSCRFQHAPLLRSARMQSLFLKGSALPGLGADRLEARGGVFLRHIKAKGEVRLNGARIEGNLECDGGRFKNQGDNALNGAGTAVRGSVFLRNVHATGAVRLLGARIGGNLECDGGRFENAEGPALSADGLEARGDVFLRGVTAKGEVRLLGARIGGSLNCAGARFENGYGEALIAQETTVTGSFFWRAGSRVDGALVLSGAEIGHIVDEPACWPKAGDLLLDRCRYGAFTGQGVSAAERIRWLDLQDPARFGDDFWPQPWEQCARVLREIGHSEDARQVLIAKEERQRRVRREIESARLTGARLRKRLERAETAESAQACFDEAEVALKALEHEGDPRRKALSDELEAASGFQRGRLKKLEGRGEAILTQVAAKAERLGTRGADATLAAQSAITDAWTRLAFLRIRDGLLGVLIAYGHRPLRTLGWLAGMWILGAVLFGIAWGEGGFKPNNAFILRSPEWAGCYEDDDRSAEDEDYRWKDEYPSTLECFLAQSEADGYPGFNGLLYSLDTLVPVVDLEVQDYWVPDETVAGWARWYLWAHIAMGWFLALLAVAGFSGLVQTRSTSE